jgi:hypothetical protein
VIQRFREAISETEVTRATGLQDVAVRVDDEAALGLGFDAARVKRALREAADPLVLVISGDIHSTVVRHGYDGIDHQAFQSLVRVHVAGRRYPGWIHLADSVTRHQVTQIASYRRPA